MGEQMFLYSTPTSIQILCVIECKQPYENVFSSADRLELGFPEEEHAVEIIRVLIDDLNRYNLAELGYEIIGTLFERLIPKVERHKLGQYFTPAEVVDLMLMFCSLRPSDVILDPAVGAGTFLVRAYQYKFLEHYRAEHEDLLPLLWGCDIDPFPAHLAAINLALRALDARSNFPRILHRDFFQLTPETVCFPVPLVDDSDDTLWGTEVRHEKTSPGLFDVIIGNPPYTRQEALTDLMPSETYKEDLVKQTFGIADATVYPPFSKRAGLHAYFFVHGYKFLKEGGRLAFLTSNSWLNADYGGSLQAFLLTHFKILAVIESDAESWFPNVNVDNCIIVLEKCSGMERSTERNENLVHFVRFHIPLVPSIVLPADDNESQRRRFKALQRLATLILSEEQPVSREDFRIYPKKQKQLLEEGTDNAKKRYIGSRWGKFTTAPDVWYKLVDPSQKMLVPLSELAEMSYGIKTGANEFFYLTEEDIQKYGIEPTFWGKTVNGVFLPNIVMKSPHESETIALDWSSLKLRVLLFHAPAEALMKTNAWSYIQMGEAAGWHAGSTCTERHERGTSFGWYDLGENLPRTTILWPELSGMRRKKKVFYTSTPVIANSKLYALYPRDLSLQELFVAVLNSTLIDFLTEFESTSYGGWVGVPRDLSLQAVRQLRIPDIRQFTTDQKRRIEIAFQRYKSRSVGSLAQEFGATERGLPSLGSISPDLRLIDSIVMGEVLGLTEQEQLSIYQTLFTLSSQRTEKVKRAASQQPHRVRQEFDEEILITAVLADAEDEIKEANNLYQQMLAGKEIVDLEVLPPQSPPFRGKPLLKETLWGYDLILGPDQTHYDPSDYGEALYRQAWALVRVPRVKMPRQIQAMIDETRTLLATLERLAAIVESYTTKIHDTRIHKQVTSRIWMTIKQRLTSLSEQISTSHISNSRKETTG